MTTWRQYCSASVDRFKDNVSIILALFWASQKAPEIKGKRCHIPNASRGPRDTILKHILHQLHHTQTFPPYVPEQSSLCACQGATTALFGAGLPLQVGTNGAKLGPSWRQDASRRGPKSAKWRSQGVFWSIFGPPGCKNADLLEYY